MEFILNPKQLKKINPSEYWNFIKRNLDKPDEIWESAIKNQLKTLEQTILWYITFSRPIDELSLKELLEECFKRRGENIDVFYFNDALKTLNSAFLQKEINFRNNKAYWRLSNPSIADYIAPMLINDNTSILVDIVISLGQKLSFATLPSTRSSYSHRNMSPYLFWDKLLCYIQKEGLYESHCELAMLGLDNVSNNRTDNVNKYKKLIEKLFYLYGSENVNCDYSIDNLELFEKLSSKLNRKHVEVDWELLCSLCLSELDQNDELIEFSNVYDNILHANKYSFDLTHELEQKIIDYWSGEIDDHVSNEFNEDILIEDDFINEYRKRGSLDEINCEELINEHINEIIENIENEYATRVDISESLFSDLNLKEIYEMSINNLIDYIESEDEPDMGSTVQHPTLDFEDEVEDEDEDFEESGDEIDELFHNH